MFCKIINPLWLAFVASSEALSQESMLDATPLPFRLLPSGSVRPKLVCFNASQVSTSSNHRTSESKVRTNFASSSSVVKELHLLVLAFSNQSLFFFSFTYLQFQATATKSTPSCDPMGGSTKLQATNQLLLPGCQLSK